MNKRQVFIISDGTGITAETLTQSLLTQFDGIEFVIEVIPFVNNLTKAEKAFQMICESIRQHQHHPLVFSTLVDKQLREHFNHLNLPCFDLFNAFIEPMEQALGVKSSHSIGKSHSQRDYNNYMLRMNAVNFALNNDDGANLHEYAKAEVILIGVSRCGKTPTCLYLALQYGIYAANYPLTEDDLVQAELPQAIRGFKKKLFGLSIDPQRLHHIRQERRPNSRYASLQQCQYEVREADALLRRKNVAHLVSTNRSIEEIATEIMAKINISRKMI